MVIKLTEQPLMAMSVLLIGYGFHELAINCNEMVVVGGVVGAMGRELRFRKTSSPCQPLPDRTPQLLVDLELRHEFVV